MTENSFNEEDLLSVGERLKDKVRSVAEGYYKLGKNVKELDDFTEEKFGEPSESFYMSEGSLYVLCHCEPFLQLYFKMVQTVRPLTHGETVTLAKRYKIAAERTVRRYLKKLYSFGLIKITKDGKYQAIPPDQLDRTEIV